MAIEEDARGSPIARAALAEASAAARPARPPRTLINRRTFVRSGFWGSMAALGAIIVGGWGIDFLWPKNITGFGAPVDVTASKIPAPGADPVHVVEGRFWLVNIPAGEADSPGGLLALHQKCPHLGCTVPGGLISISGARRGGSAAPVTAPPSRRRAVSWYRARRLVPWIRWPSPSSPPAISLSRRVRSRRAVRTTPCVSSLRAHRRRREPRLGRRRQAWPTRKTRRKR